MPKLKRLSGREVIKIFKRFGFLAVSRKGSHIKLLRIVKSTEEVLIVPDHRLLGTGITKAIYRQASRYISESDLRKEFYS